MPAAASAASGSVDVTIARVKPPSASREDEEGRGQWMVRGERPREDEGGEGEAALCLSRGQCHFSGIQ